MLSYYFGQVFSNCFHLLVPLTPRNCSIPSNASPLSDFRSQLHPDNGRPIGSVCSALRGVIRARPSPAPCHSTVVLLSLRSRFSLVFSFLRCLWTLLLRLGFPSTTFSIRDPNPRRSLPQFWYPLRRRLWCLERPWRVRRFSAPWIWVRAPRQLPRFKRRVWGVLSPPVDPMDSTLLVSQREIPFRPGSFPILQPRRSVTWINPCF